jgi:hypothetical protein
MKFSNSPRFVDGRLVDMEAGLECDLVQLVDMLGAGHPPAHPDTLIVSIAQWSLAIHAKKNL